jgi:hypothetical protein
VKARHLAIYSTQLFAVPIGLPALQRLVGDDNLDDVVNQRSCGPGYASTVRFDSLQSETAPARPLRILVCRIALVALLAQRARARSGLPEL